LAAKSPYYQAMFNSEFLEKTRSVIDIDPQSEVFTRRDSVEAIIEYFYTGNITSSPSVDTVIEIFRASSLWFLDSLQNICEYFLAASLSLDNCMDILEEAKKYNSNSLTQSCLRFMYSNQDLAEDLPSIVEELTKLNSNVDTKTPSKYYLAFHTIPHNTKLEEFIAEIEFSSEEEGYKKVGVQYRVDDKGGVAISDFTIRLPTWIDFKQFGSKRSREIKNAVIVCAAAMGESCYFGIANRTQNSQNVYKFCGILEYHIMTEGWEIIPYIPKSIVAEYRLNHGIHRANLLFFIENCPEGSKLKITNFQQHCLFVRSMEEEAIIVEQILPEVSLELDDDYSYCQNVFKINDITFFQTNELIIKIDLEDNFEKIVLESESDGLIENRYCLPLQDRDAFILVMKLYKNDCSQIEVRKYHLILDGFVSISQPESKPYSLTDPVHVVHDDDKLYVIGKLQELENSKYGVNTYNLDSDTWTFRYLEDSNFSNDNKVKLYSGSFAIYK